MCVCVCMNHVNILSKILLITKNTSYLKNSLSKNISYNGTARTALYKAILKIRSGGRSVRKVHTLLFCSQGIISRLVHWYSTHRHHHQPYRPLRAHLRNRHPHLPKTQRGRTIWSPLLQLREVRAARVCY